jgi:hypothetical protein
MTTTTLQGPKKRKRERAAWVAASSGTLTLDGLDSISVRSSAWVGIDLDDRGLWCASLIAAIDGHPGEALWGVATPDAVDAPKACFTAPVDASRGRLQSAAAAALSAIPAPPRAWTRGERVAAAAGAVLAVAFAAAVIVAAATGHSAGFDVNSI